MLPSLKVKIGADTSELDRNLSATQARLRRFARMAAAATVAVATATAALFQRTAQAIDSQAKLAQSLGTTVRSIQVLERAGELTGVSIGEITQATTQLTRRLSQAAGGAGPAAEALDRLGLSAGDLQAMPLDERLMAINEALDANVSSSERAAVASQLFGDRASVMFARIDNNTLQTATDEVDAFGVALSEIQADNIEAANDALSRIGLVFRGVANQITAALAPAVERMATAFTNAMRIGQPLRETLEAIAGRIASIGAVVVAGLAGWGAYALAIRGVAAAVALFNGALVITRAAIIRTGIGALIIGVGELTFRFLRLVNASETFGDAIAAVGRLFNEVMGRMAQGFQGVLNIAIAAAQGIAARFVQAAATIMGPYQALFNFLADGFNRLAGFTGISVEAPTATIADDLQGIADTLEGRATNAANRAGEAFRNMVAPLESLQAMRDTVAAAEQATIGLGETTQTVTDSMAAGLNNAGGAAQNLETVLTAAQERGKAAAEMIGSKMEDAMMSMIDGTKSAGEAFRDMARSIIAELYRIFVVKRITGFITRAISGAFGVPATGTAGAPSFDGGGFTGRGSRTGGIDGRGGFPAILHPNETVIDHTRGQTMGGGSVVVNQEINITTGVQQTVRAEIKQLMPQIAESAKAAVVDAKRRGGAYGRSFA